MRGAGAVSVGAGGEVPVEGLQAATVANRVLEEYSGSCGGTDDGQLGPDLSDARLRSLALNRRGDLGREYLNTLAAFELAIG